MKSKTQSQLQSSTNQLIPTSVDFCQNSWSSNDGFCIDSTTKRKTFTNYHHHSKTFMFASTLIFIVLFFLPSSLVNGLFLQPSDTEKGFVVGSQFVITCNNDKAQRGDQLKWIGPNGQEITNELQYDGKIHVQPDGNALRLMVLEVKKKDDGNYKCVLIREGKREPAESLDFKLHVYKPITIQAKPNEIAVEEDNSFSLVCNVKFDDKPKLQSDVRWLFNNQQLPKDGQFHISSPSNQPSIRSTVTIRDVNKDNAGTYTCRAAAIYQHLSLVEDFKINLKVEYKPKFPPNTPKAVWLAESKITDEPILVNITCIVDADPPATFEWLTGLGMPLRQSGEHRDLITDIINKENLSILTVKYRHPKKQQSRKQQHHHHQQLNEFRCRTNNRIGIAEAKFEIKVGAPPNVPEILSISAQPGEITLQLQEPVFVPAIDLYRIDLGNNLYLEFNATTLNETEGVPTPAPGSSNNITYIVPTGNVPTGNYRLTLYAHNPVGWSEPQREKALRIVSGANVVHHCWQSIIATLFIVVVTKVWDFYFE